MTTIVSVSIAPLGRRVCLDPGTDCCFLRSIGERQTSSPASEWPDVCGQRNYCCFHRNPHIVSRHKTFNCYVMVAGRSTSGIVKIFHDLHDNWLFLVTSLGGRVEVPSFPLHGNDLNCCISSRDRCLVALLDVREQHETTEAPIRRGGLALRAAGISDVSYHRWRGRRWKRNRVGSLVCIKQGRSTEAN